MWRVVGGCHRQIKSLLLMHCADMEETGAAPPKQAPAQFRGRKKNKNKKAPHFFNE